MLFILAMDPLQRLLDKATDQGLLNPIGADTIRMRTSLYAAAAALVIRPTVQDINNVQSILAAFGDASGLHTNMRKSALFMIQAQEVDTTQITECFRGIVGMFPTKYLGLPLHIGRTRRADEQVLVDKIGARLPGWKGRLLTRAGQLALVNSVLSSMLVYYMTSFPLSKWAIKRIDRIRRNFLWKGKDDQRRGHFPVNWIRASRPKHLGGLGIKELASFNRALRLRWPWLRWTEPTKPWVAMDIKLTDTERHLFQLCTAVTVGNGKKTCFWKDRWLNGRAPQDIAPECFKLAWRKNHSVAAALSGRRWLRGLRRLCTTEGVRQFVDLWTQLSQVQLHSAEDTITWRFSADGRYSAKSAYKVQFIGAIQDGQWNIIWRAKVENKCRFFSWLLLQSKLPTSDRILRFNGQANPICTLCRTTPEKHLHMVAKCAYTKAVWQLVAACLNIQVPSSGGPTIRAWWRSILRQGATDRDNHTQVIIYTLWNIWKERCRRVFQNVGMLEEQLVVCIKNDILAYRQANRLVE
jgi:mannosylglycoprotein endo-beta-mannosidase